MNTINRAKAQEIDRLAKAKYGISTLVLMENAGRGVFDEAVGLSKGKTSFKIAIFCGKGNNAGDGFVLARHLLANSVSFDLFLSSTKEDIKNEARVNLDILISLGCSIYKIKSTNDLEKIDFGGYSLIVDALLGIGLSGDVRGILKDIIKKLNSLALPIMSIDIPSGLDADSGNILGVCITASRTITFVAVKSGMVLGSGPRVCGNIIVKDLGIPLP